MAPGPQARPGSRQPTHLPAVQAFYAWIKKPRVASAQDEDAAGLEDFIPAGEVQAYLREDPSRLADILAALFGSEDRRWRGRAKEIVDHYSVVFAILVSIGYGEYILNFLPHQVTLCDKKLPFETRPTKFPWAPSDSVDMFDRFQEAQSRFCAVKFERNTTPEFDDSQPLPYLSKELLDEGGSAKVYKVQIHASHDMLQSSTDNSTSANEHKYYALKAYDKRGGKRWYDIETDTFKKLRHTGLESTHMVGYHCSYTHRGRHYVLLEYADMNTLEDFMEHQRPPSMDAEIVAFWRSILHVIEAIVKIHDLDPDDGDENDPFRFTAVHQDIKPRNILIKKKPHVSIYEYAFGLADLGTSSLMAAQSKRFSRDNFGTKAYGPPECFRSDSWEYRRDIKITPRVDIWSFACVLSELCVWVMFGYSKPHGVEGYRSRRELHNQATPGAANCFHHMGKLSTAVSQEHARILKQQRCDDTTREILWALSEMLQIDPEDRWSAETAREHFKRILRRAEMAIASPDRGSQSGEAPVRRATTPSRSTTISSETSSPLLPHMNPRLSTAKEVLRQDTSAGASPKFDKMLTQTPRNMTMTSDTNVNGSGSPGTAPQDLGALVQQAIQNQLPKVEAHSTTMHPLVLPDRTRQISITTELNSEQRPSALMSPFRDAGQTSSVHSQTPQPDSSDRNRSTQSKSNPTAAADAAAPVDHAGPEDRPLPVPHQNATGIPKPSIPPTPPARLAFRDAHKWRLDMKAQRSATDLPNSHLFRLLEGRDHVFVIDDGETMRDLRAINRKEGQSEVADYVDVLGYMVKRLDKDGIDLYYFNSSERILGSKNSTKLVSSVRGHKFSGVSSPENSLVKTLDAYSKKIKAFASEISAEQSHGWKSHLSLSHFKAPKLPAQLSVYVLTDGVWQLGGDEDLERTIRDLIKNLHAAKCTRKQIGIQFIRFGNNPAGIERLNALDRLGRTPGLDLDIVDTEPVENGNVWKMLLGAIDHRFDAD